MTRRGMTYVPLFFEDFKDGCEDLSNEMVGAYLRVLFEIYGNMGPIAFDDRKLAKRLNCRPHKARAIVSELVDQGKLYLAADGKISNHRAENEIAKYISISVQKQLNGSSPKLKSNSIGKKGSTINRSAEHMLSGSSHNHIIKKEESYSSTFKGVGQTSRALEEAAAKSPAVAGLLARRQMFRGVQ